MISEFILQFVVPLCLTVGGGALLMELVMCVMDRQNNRKHPGGTFPSVAADCTKRPESNAAPADA